VAVAERRTQRAVKRFVRRRRGSARWRSAARAASSRAGVAV